jgi:ferredoxin-NADP reductase
MMTEFSIWALLAQTLGILVLLAALGEATLALFAGVRRYFYEQDVYQQSLESFEERLMTARIRRVDRGRESTSWNGYRKFRVATKQPEGGGICSFYLEPHDGKPIPSFKPGQYLTFGLKVPNENKPVVRCYSLSAGPAPTHYRVSIKHALPPRKEPDAPPGKGSTHFHTRIEEGDIVDVKAPSGDFYMDLSRKSPAVLIGGGVGVTPMMSMLNALEEREFDRETWFFFGVRNAEEHVMKEYLDSIAERFQDKLHIHICYSDADDDSLPHDPPVIYHPGRVSVDLFKQVLPSSNYEYYICGPPPMMESVTTDLREWGVADAKVHFEAFGPATVKKAPKAKQAAETGSHQIPINVNFTASGTELTWNPEAGSLLDFAEENGISMDSGCRAGSCGTCVTAIKSGEVEYVSEPGEPPDAGSCLACICVPKGNLELDA